MTIATLSPAEAQALIARGARLVDIRDADEYAREHIPGAELILLDTLKNGVTLHAGPEETIAFHCQAGSRTQNNAARLAEAAAPAKRSRCWLADSGSRKRLTAGERGQVSAATADARQIAAGVLILLGVALGYAFSSGFFLLAAFVGAGLTFAE